MTTQAITINESESKCAEVLMPKPKAQGWMAWTAPQSDGAPYWMQAYPSFGTRGDRNPYSCPYPLFTTKDKALEACAKVLPNGGQCRIVRIEL